MPHQPTSLSSAERKETGESLSQTHEVSITRKESVKGKVTKKAEENFKKWNKNGGNAFKD